MKGSGKPVRIGVKQAPPKENKKPQKYGKGMKNGKC